MQSDGNSNQHGNPFLFQNALAMQPLCALLDATRLRKTLHLFKISPVEQSCLHTSTTTSKASRQCRPLPIDGSAVLNLALHADRRSGMPFQVLPLIQQPPSCIAKLLAPRTMMARLDVAVFHPPRP